MVGCPTCKTTEVARIKGWSSPVCYFCGGPLSELVPEPIVNSETLAIGEDIGDEIAGDPIITFDAYEPYGSTED